MRPIGSKGMTNWLLTLIERAKTPDDDMKATTEIFMAKKRFDITSEVAQLLFALLVEKGIF